jgi:hypothetical protein
MTIDDKDAERIARELIAEIASEWIDTPGARLLQQDGSYIFEFILAPTEIVRYTRIVERPAAISTFHFNPLAEAAEIVFDIALKSDLVDTPLSPANLRLDAKQQIHHMLLITPRLYMDAMWQARIIANTVSGLENLRVAGRPDIARELAKHSMERIEARVRSYLGHISSARNPRINDWSITNALTKFLPKFKETGKIPSQNQFAKALGVSPKGWRDFLKKQQLSDHKATVNLWLRSLLAREQQQPGSISEGESPHGTNQH